MAFAKGGNDEVSYLLNDVLPDGKGYVVMLKVYLDRGEKRDQNDCVMCVVATVFKPSAYKQFVRPWERMLRRWNASAFHATDFYSGYDEFKRKGDPKREARFQEDCRAIPTIVGENIERVLAVAFRPDEFVARASLEWKDRFGVDTHAMAVQLCLVMNAWWLQKKSSTEYFAYFQEAGDESEGRITEAVRRLRNDPHYASLIRVKSFSSVTKGVARGTEASDFVAWHWNKHAVERMGKGLEPRKDFVAFARLTELQGKVQCAFITGKKLDRYFEVLERAFRAKLAAIPSVVYCPDDD